MASIQSVQCNAASCSPDVTAHFKERGWLDLDMDAMHGGMGWDGGKEGRSTQRESESERREGRREGE